VFVSRFLRPMCIIVSRSLRLKRPLPPIWLVVIVHARIVSLSYSVRFCLCVRTEMRHQCDLVRGALQRQQQRHDGGSSVCV
jgi:hypothetical protein